MKQASKVKVQISFVILVIFFVFVITSCGYPVNTLTGSSPNSTTATPTGPSATLTQTPPLILTPTPKPTSTPTLIPLPEINISQGSTDLINGTGNYYFTSVMADGAGGAQSDNVTFLIENKGNGDLIVSGATITNDIDFKLTYDYLDLLHLPPGIPLPFTVSFDPKAFGSKTAKITMTSNDADESVYTFNVTGVGLGSDISLYYQSTGEDLASGDVIDLGDIQAGVAALSYAYLGIDNKGNYSLKIISVKLSNNTDFSQDEYCPYYLNPTSGFHTMIISFSPRTTGKKSTTVTIVSNDLDESTFTITIKGTGI